MAATPPLTVACLCAAWCRTCDDYRSAFTEVARAHASARFVWIDIEEHSDVLGEDLDVENFPTVALLRGGAAALLRHPCCRMPPRSTAWSQPRGRDDAWSAGVPPATQAMAAALAHAEPAPAACLTGPPV